MSILVCQYHEVPVMLLRTGRWWYGNGEVIFSGCGVISPHSSS